MVQILPAADNRIAQQGGLHPLAMGESGLHLGNVIGIGVVGCQVSSGGKAHQGDFLRIAVPLFCTLANQLQHPGYLLQLPGKPLRSNGIGKHQHTVSVCQKVQGNGLCLPPAAKAVGSPGANHRHRAFLSLSAHLLQRCRQVHIHLGVCPLI